MDRLFIWLLRIVFILMCGFGFFCGGAILSYMTLPFTPLTLMQFISGMVFLLFGIAMLYFIIDTWEVE